MILITNSVPNETGHVHVHTPDGALQTTINTSPITKHEALEVPFLLRESINELRVLASKGRVDPIVRTHKAANASSNALCKWPSVKFVYGPIIDI